tara:strand:+ start:18512 stop:19993 length:1482 start_codon:yes stop_codon:yes gene_type:complete
VNDQIKIPNIIPNWIAGLESFSDSNKTLEKMCPHKGKIIYSLTDSDANDVKKAISIAKEAQIRWMNLTPVERGKKLYEFCEKLEANKLNLANIVARETGKSPKDALGETQGAIDLGRFFAGEGQRLYGRTTTSGQLDKYSMTVRQPCGLAGLIVAANTPIANIAWKVFPALICGNAIILKVPEDTPAIGWLFGKYFHEIAGLPMGLLNVIQGQGDRAGAPIVKSNDVDVISFTGSTQVGKWIGEVAGGQLKKVSLELGGKNPLIVCDDANLKNAVSWSCLSAFSNAGQRCAAGSRIIVFESIYEKFKKAFIQKTSELKLGNTDNDDLGPVINLRQLNSMIKSVESAEFNGAKVLIGGSRYMDDNLEEGYYMSPTIIENISTEDEIHEKELFGPIAQLYKVSSYEEAMHLANSSSYGLTACIHTTNFDRASDFSYKIKSGVAVVNAGTYGSEPHMPFGGLGLSGNGSREPGTEALDVYSELKDIYLNVNRSNLD